MYYYKDNDLFCDEAKSTETMVECIKRKNVKYDLHYPRIPHVP